MKHIIWDFNGTLLSDVALSVMADNLTFDVLGLPHITEEQYKRNMTMPVIDFYTNLGLDWKFYSYDELSRIWLDIFNEHAVSVGLVPGALDTIRRFAAEGRAQSVLSASYEPSLLSQCDALGLTPHMQAVAGRSDESAGKKTEIARRLFDRLGIRASDAVLVGDMVADAELAHELGAACVLVSWGHNDLERLQATGLPLAGTFSELEDILKNI